MVHSNFLFSPSFIGLLAVCFSGMTALAAPSVGRDILDDGPVAAAWPGTVGAFMCTAKDWGHPLDKNGKPTKGDCQWVQIFGSECRTLQNTIYDRNISSFGPDKGLKCVLFETPDCSLRWPGAPSESNQTAPSSLNTPINVAPTVTFTSSSFLTSTSAVNTTMTTQSPSIAIVTVTSTIWPQLSGFPVHSANGSSMLAPTASQPPMQTHLTNVTSAQNAENPSYMEVWWPGYPNMSWNGWDDRVRSFRCVLE